MALDSLSAKITGYRDGAARVRADQATTLSKIRSDNTISSVGKERLIARVYLDTREKLRKYAQQENDDLTKAREDLERRVFGILPTSGENVMYYRDAQDRASRLTPDDRDRAADLLYSAQISGDTTLATALVARALHFGWTEMIDSHRAHNPNTSEAMTDLANVQRFQTNAHEELQRSFTYMDERPSELTRHSEGTIADLAAGAANVGSSLAAS